MPIRNRAAQADLITDELNYRQQQIQDKQLQNSIKLNVINAQTALRQARLAYDSAVQARRLQELTLNGEKRKYELGNVDDLPGGAHATRRHRARAVRGGREEPVCAFAECDAAGGRHDAGGVRGGREEAKTGVVKREPDLIPAIVQNR